MRKLFFVVIALLFAACTTDVTEDVAVESPETLMVSFEEDTRIQLMNGKTVWNEGDLVSVFYKSDANDCYKFTGTTGERTSELLRVSKGEKSRSGDHIITVYPYSEDYIISLSAGTIEAHLPAEQTYVNESFGIGSSPMVSMSEYKQVVLKNVCGWLKVQFTGNGEVVDKITLRGNCGEQVAGDIMIVAEDASTILASAGVSIDDTQVGGTLVDEQSILTEVSLICPDGVTLGSEPTSFYIALPPQTFSKGLTVKVISDKSGVMKQTTDKSITISRNIVQPLASVEANLQPNKIYYTSTNGKIVTPYRTTAFGEANIVSNTYKDGQGIITFDAPVTEIGDRAFYSCSSLTSVTIPDRVTTIGDWAFEDCSRLTSITIPDSVTTLGDNPFVRCSKLTEFNGKFASADKRYLIVDGVLNSFAIGCGLTEYTIPDSVTEIGRSAFKDCSSLTSVTIPNSVTKIENSAFYDCSSLTNVTIPDSVTTIESSAFRNCTNLASITIPDSVTTIGRSAFGYCSSLTSITIPDSVTTLGDNPFVSCSKLTEFNGKFASADKRCLIVDGVLNSFAIGCGLTEYAIPNSVTEIGNYAFYKCSSLTSVTIPDSVTTIGESAFSGCSGLTAVTIGNGVTSIGFYAFWGCSNLTSVTIGNRVTEIGGYAFYNCSSLTSITIPNSVTTIEYLAFNGCTSLKEVYCKSTIPPSAYFGTYSTWKTFDYNASDRKIYVPASDDDSVINAYKAAAGWSEYAADIVEYNFTE